MVVTRKVGGQADGPFEGVPTHLSRALLDWWGSVIGDREHVNARQRAREINLLVALLRFDAPGHWSTGDTVGVLLDDACRDQQFFLDLVDGTLQVFDIATVHIEALTRLLRIAGSVWTVAPDRQSLIRVVTEEVQELYEAGTSVPDEVSTELSEAWSNAFGRDGDPSDAWDHAIKAVEEVLIPEVMPKNTKATLGTVLGELTGQNRALWKLVLPGNHQDHDVAHLVSVLQLIWPNHDRHGGSTKRSPSEQEGRAVVALAATIVQWHRQGWVVQRR